MLEWWVKQEIFVEIFISGKFKLAADKFRGTEFIPNVTDNPEDMFWYAITLASVGRVEDAKPILKELLSVNPTWRELVPRLIKVGLLSDREKAIAQLLEQVLN